jgi:hypothetical protein
VSRLQLRDRVIADPWLERHQDFEYKDRGVIYPNKVTLETLTEICGIWDW